MNFRIARGYGEFLTAEYICDIDPGWPSKISERQGYAKGIKIMKTTAIIKFLTVYVFFNKNLEVYALM